MPELPEVETVRRGLAPALEGQILIDVRLSRADLRFPFPAEFTRRIEGARVGTLTRRAKYLLAELDRGETLVMHLGMSGRFDLTYADSQQRPGAFNHSVNLQPKHAHVQIKTEAGAQITYFDPRRFGYMDLIATERLTRHAWFAHMGPEPLSVDFTVETLRAGFERRKQTPKSLLLDQRLVAGLGNIYVCEALHRAAVSPIIPAKDVSPKAHERLVIAIRAVLLEAIDAGGSTLRDYAAADGSLGYFQHRFQVYGRAGQPCLTSGCNGEIRRTSQGGRSTFWCETCQT